VFIDWPLLQIHFGDFKPDRSIRILCPFALASLFHTCLGNSISGGVQAT
jgi:hypothetical protein